MTQERLNHVLILHCHKARAESVDGSQIASTFVGVNERRQKYFGEFVVDS